MRKRVGILAGALIAGLAWCGTAAASPIVYTFTGKATGSYSGPTSGDGTFTAADIVLKVYANTSDKYEGPYFFKVPYTDADISLGSFAGPLNIDFFSGGTHVIAFGKAGMTPDVNGLGWITEDNGGLLDEGGQFYGTGLQGYDGLSALAPTSIRFLDIEPGDDDLELADGTIIDLGSISDATFSAAFAVPEPATWSLMLVGFGAAGAVLRKRRVHFA